MCNFMLIKPLSESESEYSVNDGRCYIVMSSLIGWAHIQIDPWFDAKCDANWLCNIHLASMCSSSTYLYVVKYQHSKYHSQLFSDR